MNLLTRLWWKIPMDRLKKEKLKDIIFLSAPSLFRKNRVYLNWKIAREWGQPTLPSKITTFSPKLNSNPVVAQAASPEKMAIIVHVFHFEIFYEVMEYISRYTSVRFKLFITAPGMLVNKLTAELNNRPVQYQIKPVENRGRDMLPFLTILPEVLNQQYSIILKIHTKKNDRRLAGKYWRKDLFYKLLTVESIHHAIHIFRAQEQIGMIVPEGHLVPVSLYYGSSAERIDRYCRILGLEAWQIADLNFAAGSMFYIRAAAIKPLLNLGISAHDFEPETGQVDGTMAHALERVIAASAYAAGYQTVDTAWSPKKNEISVTRNHRFTQ